MKKYLEPAVEFIELKTEDIILASGYDDDETIRIPINGNNSLAD